MSDIDLMVYSHNGNDPVYLTDISGNNLTGVNAYDQCQLWFCFLSKQPDTEQDFDISITVNGNLFSVLNRTVNDPGFWILSNYWTMSFQPGTYSITLTVDPENKIRETDETNNTYTFNFTVRGNSNWLMDTTWSQSGTFLGDSTLELNAYCPIEPGKKDHSVTGCSNTAAAQILYYFADQGHKFTLQLNNDDKNTANPAITIDSTAYNAAKYNYLSFSEVNKKLEVFDTNSAEDVAALIFASGVIAKSEYTANSTSTYATDSLEVFKRAGFKNVTLSYNGGPDGLIDKNKAFTDAGWETVKKNIREYKPIFTSIYNHAVVIDGYDSTTDSVHINFGWGLGGNKAQNSNEIEDGSGWYTRSECAALKIDSIIHNITPDTQKPTISVSTDTTAAGAKSVTLTATFTDDVGVYKQFYQVGGTTGTWKEYTSPVTVYQNCTVYFKVTDKFNNEQNKSYTVTNIQLAAPEISVSNTKLTNQSITVSAVFDPGAITNEYSLNGSSWTTYTKALTISANTTVYFRSVKGSETAESSVVINNIDKDKPAVSITPSTTDPTREDVVVTISATDTNGIKSIQYSIDKQNWTTGSKITFTENKQVYIKVTDNAGNIYEETVTVNNIDKEAPKLTVSGNATKFTNQDVTLSASASDGKIEYFDNGRWIEGNTLTVSENGTYSFRATDEVGNVTTQEIVVDKIDKAPPVLAVSGNPDKMTNQDVILSASASDLQNSTIYYKKSTDTDFRKYTGNITVKENCTYIFYAEDDFFNKSAETAVIVDKIDKIAPETPLVSANITAMTNQNVTVSAEFADDVVIKEYSFDNSNWQKYTAGAVIKNNTMVYFRGFDEAGNVSSASYEVTNIDKAAPELTVSGNATKFTNQDVILSASASDGKIEYFDNGRWIEGNTLTVSENGTFSFRATDEVGNVAIQEVIVDKIDKIAPTLEISGNPQEWTNQDVVLKATASDGKIEYLVNGKWSTGNTLTVTENGEYQFRVTDEAGNTVSRNIIVDKIDRFIPIVSCRIEIQNNVYMLKLNASDIGSGVSGYQVNYSVDNGKSWNGYIKFTAENDLTVSGLPDSDIIFQIKALDLAGNWSKNCTLSASEAKTLTGDDKDSLIFVSAKYTGDQINGKKQNGIVLQYGVNAFASIEEVLAKYPRIDTGKLIILDKKADFNTAAELPTLAGTALLAESKNNENSYSYQASYSSQNSLNITENTDTDFLRFSTVTLNGAQAGSISGGKESSSENTKQTQDRKGNITDTRKYSYSRSLTGKFTGSNGAEADTIGNYSTVVLNSATADKLIGGTEKATISDKYVDGITKDSKSLSATVSKGVSGKLTLSDGASAAEISNYSTVTVNNASTGVIKNTVIKNTRKETSSFDQAKRTVSRNVTLSYSETASGTLNAANATLGNVTGFATVTLKNVVNAGDFRRVAEDGSAYSTVKETLKISTGKVGIVSGNYTKTETFTRSGKLTATDSVIGDVENFNTVTLSGTSAGDISNILDSQITTTGGTIWYSADEYGSTDDYSIDLSDFNLQTAVKRSLSGSVTLKNGADVKSVTDFKTLTMTGSKVDTVKNVSQVTVSKGDSMIGARILDGDVVFIRAQEMVENGKIAAVIIDNEATLKRWYYFPEKQKLVLTPENPAYEPLVYVGDELTDIKCIGLAVSVMSRL